MDATFEFFNSPSNSSASSVCGDDDDEDNKNASDDSDSSAEDPVPHSGSPCKNLKVCESRRTVLIIEFI